MPFLKRSCLQFKTLAISPRNTVWRSCWDREGDECRAAALVLPSGLSGTDQGLLRAAFAPAVSRPISSAGPRESRSHYPGMICTLCKRSRPYVCLEQKPRTIIRGWASFLLWLSPTFAHQLGQSHANFYLKKWLFPGFSLCLMNSIGQIVILAHTSRY